LVERAGAFAGRDLDAELRELAARLT
jgi:hypothetical protein